MGTFNWYALYTRPRWEKKVTKSLSDKGFIVYCPLNKILRQWSDRKKIVLEPLIKGYVFVQIEEYNKLSVKTVNGIVNFVYWNGKPAIVRDSEIETLKRFLSEFHDVRVESIEVLHPNDRVVIKKGVLVNYKGVIIEVLGNKAKVLIESMGISLSATIDKNNLQVI